MKSRRSPSALWKSLHPKKRGLLMTGTLIIVALMISACGSGSTASNYEPSSLEEVKGSELKRVTLTAEAARRTGIKIAEVKQAKEYSSVPYYAVIYDDHGDTFVYTVLEPFVYIREPIKIAAVENDRVLLLSGPELGTPVVTVGANEVYGAELEVGK